jgi:serine/threonine-protein kinase RsbW
MPPTVRAARTAATPVITWARAFPAVPAQVAEARRFLAGLLDAGPAADDAVLCLSELAANAIVHSRSREPGGSFSVRVQVDEQRLRVEVGDQGGPWHSPARATADEPGGRGLLIVGRLASRWGCEGHSRTGWTVWFERDLDTR